MKSKKSFLIYCADPGQSVDLLEIILGVGPALVSIISDITLLEDQVEMSLPDALVLKTDHLDAQVGAVLEKVKKKSPKSVFVVITDLILDEENRKAYASGKEYEHTFLIDSVHQDSQLAGLCEKINSKGKLFFRRYPRFNTDIPAILGRTVDGDKTCKGSVLNMSRGGAYMRTEAGEFQKGEILELSMRVKNRSHHLHAEVVWTAAEGVGLKFMTPESIYNELVDVD